MELTDMTTILRFEDKEYSEKKKRKRPQPVRSFICDLGLPTPQQYEDVEKTYYANLTAGRKEKALISTELYGQIVHVLAHPADTKSTTAQFRFWVRKMFGICHETGCITHQCKPVAAKERIYDLLCLCHSACDHGGRDRTNAEVRSMWSWIPKDLVALFVAACPTCQMARNGTVQGIDAPEKRRKVLKVEDFELVNPAEGDTETLEVGKALKPFNNASMSRNPLAGLSLNRLIPMPQSPEMNFCSQFQETLPIKEEYSPVSPCNPFFDFPVDSPLLSVDTYASALEDGAPSFADHVTPGNAPFYIPDEKPPATEPSTPIIPEAPIEEEDVYDFEQPVGQSFLLSPQQHRDSGSALLVKNKSGETREINYNAPCFSGNTELHPEFSAALDYTLKDRKQTYQEVPFLGPCAFRDQHPIQLPSFGDLLHSANLTPLGLPPNVHPLGAASPRLSDIPGYIYPSQVAADQAPRVGYLRMSDILNEQPNLQSLSMNDEENEEEDNFFTDTRAGGLGLTWSEDGDDKEYSAPHASSSKYTKSSWAVEGMPSTSSLEKWAYQAESSRLDVDDFETAEEVDDEY